MRQGYSFPYPILFIEDVSKSLLTLRYALFFYANNKFSTQKNRITDTSFKNLLYLCSMNSKRKEKLGDLLLDIAKYIITAILFATWFSDISNWEWYSYLLPITAVVVAASVGLSLFKDNNKKKKGKKS